MAFLDTIRGWEALTALDPLAGFVPVPTNGFGYASFGDTLVFLAVPTGETGALDQIAPSFGAFGRLSAGTPTERDPTQNSTVTVADHLFDDLGDLIAGDLPIVGDIPSGDIPSGDIPSDLSSFPIRSFPAGDTSCPQTVIEDLLGPDAKVLCLADRFEASAEQTSNGEVIPPAEATLQDDGSGLFFFVESPDWELLVKMFDACDFNGTFWIFMAATTNVEYTLTVTDTATGSSKAYENDLGQSQVILDTAAHATCP